jgi:DNA-binding beta-propeller fold protein YncE
MVYIAGCGDGGSATGTEYTTAGYSAATGALAWVSHYANTRVRYACAHAVAVSRSGATVYVTGSSGQSSFETIAYAARTGHQIWARRYFTSSKDWAFAAGMAVSPRSGSVYVTGGVSNSAYLTVGYRG